MTDRSLETVTILGATGSIGRQTLSIRSSMPPWPGSTVPLSLMPRWRLAMLSNRSPSTDALSLIHI